MIGVSSLCMLDSTLEQVLETINDVFSSIEVISEGNHTNLQILESYNYSVSFHAPFSDLNIGSLNKAILKESLNQITETIERAPRYNVKAICIHPGHYSPLGMHFREAVHDLQVASLKYLAKKAEENGVFLGVENMPHFPILCARTYEEIERIIKEVDSPRVGFTFDVGHAHVSGNLTGFLQLKDFIEVVHLHDNYGDQDAHLALGDGTIPLEVIKNLHDKRLIIEVNTYEDALRSLEVLNNLI
ncbi:MAG: sugar phosphate isomerase/epimerase [Theionarchaea archaeon]|nr:sugar phosphate isomerase/epimerase [Theionarchaea archaeon]